MKSKTTASLIWLLLLFTLAGCRPTLPDQKESPFERERDEKPDQKQEVGITAQVRAARQEQEAAYRERLRAIAADVRSKRIVYPTKLELELSEASREAGAPVKQIFAKTFPTSGTFTDPEAVAASIEQIAAAYE